jgi:hypothetical protein
MNYGHYIRLMTLVTLVMVATWWSARWSARCAVRPYGYDVFIVTSDTTFFRSNPNDTIPGQNSLITIGNEYTITGVSRPYRQWADPIKDWSSTLIGQTSATVEAVDTLLRWWRPRLESFPFESDLLPDIIPLAGVPWATLLMAPRENQHMLCGPQAGVFSTILESYGVPCRTVGLNTTYDLASPEHSGHIVLEAWNDESHSWILVDPMMGTRYTLNNQPLSLLDMARLRHAERLNEVTVEYPGSRLGFYEHPFTMRFLGTDDMSSLFNTVALYYNRRHLEKDRLMSGPTDFYVYWDPTQAGYKHTALEKRSFGLNITIASALWGITGIAAAFMIRRRKKLTNTTT